MKSLIIFCIMGLISIFDCKGGGERIVEVLGPELMNQVRWCEVGMAYWDYHYIENFIGTGTKVSCTGVNAGPFYISNLLGVWGKRYRVVVNITLVSGWFELWGGGGDHYDLQVNQGGRYEFDLICKNMFGRFIMDSSMFDGEVLSLSVKEVNYNYGDE